MDDKTAGAGVLLYIAARRSTKGLMIVVGTKNTETMIEYYSRRWGIESLFGCLKSRGFEIESTHMSDPEKWTNSWLFWL